jgi:hypothetical protein
MQAAVGRGVLLNMKSDSKKSLSLFQYIYFTDKAVASLLLSLSKLGAAGD